MNEVDAAAERIRSELDPNANIIFGAILDEEISGKMRVSLVATGIDDMVNGTVETKVDKPVVPEPKPVNVTPPESSITLSEKTTEIKVATPPVIEEEIPLIPKDPAPFIIPERVTETERSDMVITFDESPIVPEPDLLNDPTPIMPEPVAILDMPEVRPEIDMDPKKVEENVKPVSASIWDSLFRPMKKKTPKMTPRKEEHTEPSFLDDLESEMDLPPFLKQRR